MTALTAEELLRWVEATSDGWRKLLAEHPEALKFECDVRAIGTVGKLLQHIVAVELRYAERLAGEAESSYDEIGYGSAEEVYATHDRVMRLLGAALRKPDTDWEERIEFSTLSMGRLRASRRAILVHALMHSIRHYAQLATLVRQHGVKPGWPMDYLMMDAQQI